MKNIENFRKSLAFVLKHKGGYVNNPADPGGETKWGISKRAYPNLDIKNLTPEQACDIYSHDYWDKAGCDALAYPLCCVVFDSTVQHGVSRALGWLKQATNVKDYLNLRKGFYLSIQQSNPTLFYQMKAGWLARLSDLQKLIDVTAVDSDYDVTQLPDWHY